MPDAARRFVPDECRGRVRPVVSRDRSPRAWPRAGPFRVGSALGGPARRATSRTTCGRHSQAGLRAVHGRPQGKSAKLCEGVTAPFAGFRADSKNRAPPSRYGQVVRRRRRPPLEGGSQGVRLITFLPNRARTGPPGWPHGKALSLNALPAKRRRAGPNCGRVKGHLRPREPIQAVAAPPRPVYFRSHRGSTSRLSKH